MAQPEDKKKWKVRQLAPVCQNNLNIFFKSETPLSLVLGGIRTHNLLIFVQTSKPSCL